MKKILLSLAAVTFIFASQSQAAEPDKKGLKLGIGGYFTAFAVGAHQDEPAGIDTHGVDIQRKAELHFAGETTFDSGLTTGAEIVLKGEPSDEQIQQSYLYMAGNWGRVELGANYSAAYLLTNAMPGVDAENFDGPDPDFILAESGLNRASAGYVPFYQSGDLLAEKITYFTPRFNGFQAGLSYTPDASRQGVINANVIPSITGNDGTGGNSSKGPGTAGLAANNNPGDQRQRVEVGANFEKYISGFNIAASVSYGTASLEGNVPSAFVDSKDEDAFNAGLNLTFEKVTVGGGYFWDNNGFSNRTAGGAETADGETNNWYAGIRYDMGPWDVGANYLRSRIDTANTVGGVFTADSVKDTLNRYIVGGNYEVGPGVKFTGTVQFHEYDRTGGATAVVNDAGRNDATLVTVGTTVNF